MGKWKRSKSNRRRWQRNHLIAKYGCICFLCNHPLTMKEVTIDHYEPLGKGGSDTLDNYRLAHSACNNLKADMTPEEFELFQQGWLQYI